MADGWEQQVILGTEGPGQEGGGKVLTGSLALLSSLDLQRDCWGTQGEGMGPAGETHPSEGNNINVLLPSVNCIQELGCKRSGWRYSCSWPMESLTGRKMALVKKQA